MKILIIITIILFLSSTAYAQESPKYTYSGSEKKEVLDQRGDGKKGGVFTGGPTGVSAKGGQGKSIAAFPDVCLTPPSSPPGAKDMEEPNFADTEDGKSKSTKMHGMLKTLHKERVKDKETGERVYPQNRTRRERIRRALRKFFKK